MLLPLQRNFGLITRRFFKFNEHQFRASNQWFPKVQKMSEIAIVKHFDGEPRFTLSFHLCLPAFKINKQFNLNRDLNEEKEAFLGRVENNVNKANKIKGTNVVVKIIQEIEGTMKNVTEVDKFAKVGDFILHDNLKLHIDNLVFPIKVNPPLVRELKISDTVMTGFMIYPYSLILDFADSEKTKIEWFVSQKINESENKNLEKKIKSDAELEGITWSKVHEGWILKPEDSHINCFMKCSVTPVDGEGQPGLISSVVAGQLVTAGPQCNAINSRHGWTSSKVTNEDEFRITSYNILADLYADSDYSRSVLFSQCPPYALSINYRVKLLLSEIIGYNSDIITLQEVDRKIFQNDLEPILDKDGLSGMFVKKGGQVTEGLATFYRRDKFKQISFSSVFLPEALKNDETFDYILSKVKGQDKLMESLTNRTTTVSVMVLEHISTGNIIIVGNTHLYFEPNADHIRLIQTEMCRLIISNKKLDIERENPQKKCSIIFNGDFNSTPPFGVLEYLTTGFIGSDHMDWRSQEGEEVLGLELNHEPIFKSAAGTPKYTNYTLGFKECIDYCWIEKSKLAVTQVVPFPSEEELSQFDALPNIVFPSDHIAVVVDLKFL